jgi:glycosyltransferase involved in cell wall biosynthesis
MSPSIAINGRFRTQPLSGVQRVAGALTARLRAPHEVIAPPAGLPWALGHPWEQLVLPARAGRRVLWSPCNTGPVGAARHVVTLHDAAVLDHPEWFSRSYAALYAQLWPRLARRAKLVTVSAFSRGRLAERLGVAEEDIAVVPNGVDPRFRPATEAEVAAVRRAHGLGEAPYFLTLSTLEPRKNLALVLRAWEQARRSLPGVRLVVAGAAGRRTVFAAAAPPELAEAPDVAFTGHVAEAELPALIGGARALLYPSLYEGFGLPVLEAMACATAVVTTRCGALPEVGGEAALYVDPQAAEDLAATLVRLAEDAAWAQSLATAGPARAAAFSWEAAARAMEGILAARS